MDVNEEAMAAHKRAFLDFLDQDVSPLVTAHFRRRLLQWFVVDFFGPCVCRSDALTEVARNLDPKSLPSFPPSSVTQFVPRLLPGLPSREFEAARSPLDPSVSREFGSAMAGDASPAPEIPTRCQHCAGPLSKDMMETRMNFVPLSAPFPVQHRVPHVGRQGSVLLHHELLLPQTMSRRAGSAMRQKIHTQTLLAFPGCKQHRLCLLPLKDGALSSRKNRRQSSSGKPARAEYYARLCALVIGIA
ncbi:hypothetical protein GUJ93_ZPchr0458g22678 [Zizania palustris]|uniref:Uncharacterized protein n=1 Tax=Zizania palustris TaxID=103762 RepID=A0A8J5RDC1_ZIZPA|nr:hypothetical protein GUJ93_ZPchr0458g22678 [Zizania palustris]